MTTVISIIEFFKDLILSIIQIEFIPYFLAILTAISVAVIFLTYFIKGEY